MSNWQLTPVTQAQLMEALRELGLDPHLTPADHAATADPSSAHNQVVTADYEDLVLSFLLVASSIIVRVDLHLDTMTASFDLPAIMAANSVNCADTGARAAILQIPTPSPPTSPSESIAERQDTAHPVGNSATSLLLRVEHEIPLGPGLTPYQMSANLSRALTSINRTLDAMVVELERLADSPA